MPAGSGESLARIPLLNLLIGFKLAQFGWVKQAILGRILDLSLFRKQDLLTCDLSTLHLDCNLVTNQRIVESGLLVLGINVILPAPTVITSPGKIAEMISISKWAISYLRVPPVLFPP